MKRRKSYSSRSTRRAGLDAPPAPERSDRRIAASMVRRRLRQGRREGNRALDFALRRHGLEGDGQAPLGAAGGGERHRPRALLAGPAAAGPAAAEATVISVGSGLVAAADIGMWQSPSDQLAMIHRNELVMPAAEAGAFRSMLSKRRRHGERRGRQRGPRPRAGSPWPPGGRPSRTATSIAQIWEAAARDNEQRHRRNRPRPPRALAQAARAVEDASVDELVEAEGPDMLARPPAGSAFAGTLRRAAAEGVASPDAWLGKPLALVREQGADALLITLTASARCSDRRPCIRMRRRARRA